MKRLIPLLIAVILLFTCVNSIDSSGQDTSIRLTGVLPTSSFEGVEITNFGSDVNLMDCKVSDGEGDITFSSSITLRSGKSIWILKSEPAKWFPANSYLVIGKDGVSASKFALNDSGDDVYLRFNGTLVDTFVYGDVQGEKEGWKGSPFEKPAKYSYASRESFFDTDTAADWRTVVPGRTDIDHFDEYDTEVETFVFPDSHGYPVLSALLAAQKEVSISIYSLSQNDVIAVLEKLLKQNVVVNILCDGSPVGGIGESELKALATLSDDGATVRLIKQDDDGFKRYSYLHNKYAVIDGSKVIITSENWVDSSFAGNRGWGAIIHSQEYAKLMKSIFDNDFDISNSDIVDFRTAYPKQKSAVYYSDMNFDHEVDKFDAKISPVLSPDNSYSAMRELISGAKEKVYSEQLDIQYSWLEQSDNPLKWMIAQGEKGADCRLMLDVTFDSIDDEDTEDNYGIISKLAGNPYITCKTVVGNFSVVHNKGVIADDKVWVGSVNWTYNSFKNNRESAVIIESLDVSNFFTQFYLTDWGISEDAIVPKIVPKGSLIDGESFILDASSSTVNPGSKFLWDLDGDGVFEKEGETIMLTLPSGHHSVTLKITDGDGNVKVLDYSFDVSEKASITEWKYIPLIVLCAMILLIKGIKTYRAKCR